MVRAGQQLVAQDARRARRAVPDPAAGRAVEVLHDARDAVSVGVADGHPHAERPEREAGVRRVHRQRQLLGAAVVRRLEAVGPVQQLVVQHARRARRAVADPAAGRAVEVLHAAGDAVVSRVEQRDGHVARREREQPVRGVDCQRLLQRAAVPGGLEGVGAGVQGQVHRAVAARRLHGLPAAAGVVVGDLRAGQRRAGGVDQRNGRRHRRGTGNGGQPGEQQQRQDGARQGTHGAAGQAAVRR